MKMQSNSMFANVIFRVFSFHDFGVFLRERWKLHVTFLIATDARYVLRHIELNILSIYT
jgi:hypothetical protein